METNDDEPTPAVRRRRPVYTNEKSTTSFVISIVKKMTIVGVIYCAGYMNWSIAWLITPILLSETRQFLCDTNIVRRKIAKESARGKEIDAILARVEDLPSWVLTILCFIVIEDALLQRFHFCRLLSLILSAANGLIE